ncbi:F-box domain protein [Paraphaeosphaeria sporulosa]
MASFPDCPTELIDSILQRLSFRDLLAVSVVSKRLHKCATPLCYSQIDLSIHRDNPHSIIYLCRSIFNKPELAAHIDSVRLRDGEPADGRRYCNISAIPKASPPRPTNKDGMSKFVTFVSHSGLAYADIWTEKLRIGDLNAFVALFLSRLPNLKSFRVGNLVVLPDPEKKELSKDPPTAARDMENQFLGKIFQSAVFDPSNHGISRFQYLEHISFPWCMTPWPGKNPDFCKPEDMMALLSLPSVCSISGWCLNPESLPFSWPVGPPELAHLTSLSLTHIHVDFLAQILERTRALKELRWVWKHTPDVDPLNTDTMNLDRFVEVLLAVQDTLEDLNISVDIICPWFNPEFQNLEIRGCLSGLRNMVNIKRFKAPFGLLLPDWDGQRDSTTRRLEDSIPPNVEVVTISDDDTNDYLPFTDREDEWPKLRSWLSETAWKTTPHLKEVRLFLQKSSDAVHFNRLDELEAIFKGIDLPHKLIHESETSHRWDWDM